jgi:hypothetical protein
MPEGTPKEEAQALRLAHNAQRQKEQDEWGVDPVVIIVAPALPPPPEPKKRKLFRRK